MSLAIRVDEEVSLHLAMTKYAEEVAALVQANVDYVGRWLPWCTKNYAAATYRSWASASLEAFGQRKQLPLLVVEHGRVVGGCGWNEWRQTSNDDADHHVASAEIGYWLARDATGRGLITRCVRRLLDYGFDEVGLQRMVIRADPDNKPSQAVPRRLGFTHEGTARRVATWNRRPVDMQIYAMLAEQWRSVSKRQAAD